MDAYFQTLRPTNRTPVRFAHADGGLYSPGRLWRYYSMLPLDTRRHPPLLCLVFKNAELETWVGAACSSDGGLTFAQPALVMPSVLLNARMSHNLALQPDILLQRWIAIGGQHRPTTGRSRGWGDDSPVRDNGVFLSISRDGWCFDESCSSPQAARQKNSARTEQWSHPVKILDGGHAGCIERNYGHLNPKNPRHAQWREGVKRRAATYGAGEGCEFDGRLSLVRHRDKWMLFARANTGKGVREVQVTTSQDLRVWSPFRPVRFQGLTPTTLTCERNAILSTNPVVGKHPVSEVESQAACETLCSRTADCVALVYNKYRQCFLKTKTGATKADDRKHESVTCQMLRSAASPVAAEVDRRARGIYFFGVQRNPLQPESLVAIFPLIGEECAQTANSIHLQFRSLKSFPGCIALSTSLDGFSWSRPSKIVPCELGLVGDHTTAQSAMGLHNDAQASQIRFWVHENVAGINARGGFRPSAELVRYSIDARAFLSWTRESLATLSYPVLSSPWMLRAADKLPGLVRYLYPMLPAKAFAEANLTRAWRPLSKGCSVFADSCFCMHVPGSPLKALNPDGWRAPGAAAANPGFNTSKLVQWATKNCSCIAPRMLHSERNNELKAPPPSGCLFGDMRPLKLLAIISACRALGVTHIIEEGRYGGMSTFIYAQHGFRVTSIELVGIDSVSEALKQHAPSIELLEGDGSALLPALLANVSDPSKVAVIFDGEKRFAAYRTFQRIRARVALAVFDDSPNNNEGFPEFLGKQGEVAWHTWDRSFLAMYGDKQVIDPFSNLLRQKVHSLSSRHHNLTPARRAQLVDKAGRLQLPPGYMNNLGSQHLSIVKGDAAAIPHHSQT